MTSTATMTQEEKYHTLAEKLGQSVVLASLQVSRWRGRFRTQEVKISIDGKEYLPGEETTKPSFLFFSGENKQWEKAFDKMEHRLRSTLAAASIPIVGVVAYTGKDGKVYWDQVAKGGQCIIPRTHVQGVRDTLETMIEKEWMPLVNSFVEAWPAAKEKFAKDSPALFAMFCGSLPEPQDLRRFFDVSFWTVPIGIMKDSLNAGADQFLDTVRTSLLANALSSLKDNLASVKKKIDEGKSRGLDNSLDNVASSIRLLKSVGELAGDSATLDAIFALESDITMTDTKELKNQIKYQQTQASEELLGVLNRLSGFVDTAAEESFGRKRGLILD